MHAGSKMCACVGEDTSAYACAHKHKGTKGLISAFFLLSAAMPMRVRVRTS